MPYPSNTHNDTESQEPMDPTESLRILRQRESASHRLEPDDRKLFLVWGLSWLIGYTVLWLNSNPIGAVAGWAGNVFALLLIAAAIYSAIHVSRRTAGLKGPSATGGNIYAWSWILSFIAVFAIYFRISTSEIDAAVENQISFALPVFVVGILLMSGAAIVQSFSGFFAGAWIVAALLVSLFIGMPHAYAGVGFAGGGGMVLTAAFGHMQRKQTSLKSS